MLMCFNIVSSPYFKWNIKTKSIFYNFQKNYNKNNTMCEKWVVIEIKKIHPTSKILYTLIVYCLNNSKITFKKILSQ
jgi:hypothetical protein